MGLGLGLGLGLGRSPNGDHLMRPVCPSSTCLAGPEVELWAGVGKVRLGRGRGREGWEGQGGLCWGGQGGKAGQGQRQEMLGWVGAGKGRLGRVGKVREG